jgi:hypothetical protein
MAKLKRDILEIASYPDPVTIDFWQRTKPKITENDIALGASLIARDLSKHDEKEGRRALARVVLHYIPGALGDLFAKAIHPSAVPDFPERPCQIKFEGLARGKRPTLLGRVPVVLHITERLSKNDKLDAALKSAEERFGYSSTKVKSIWYRHRPSFYRSGT